MTTPTVLITGASGHLGRAVVARFHRDGARLVLLDRQLATLRRDLADGTDDLMLDRAQVQHGLAQALDHMGGIDVVCHLAGGFQMGQAVHKTSAEHWDMMMDLNARSLVHLAAAVVPHLITRGAGRIITVGAQVLRRAPRRAWAPTVRPKAH